MKKHFAITGMLTISICVALGSALPNSPLTYPVMIQHNAGLGSGFFMQLSNSVYLITARHVLFSEWQGANPPSLLATQATVIAYSGPSPTNIHQVTVTIDLGHSLRSQEVRFSTNRDVAIVRIQECKQDNHTVVRDLAGISVSGNESLSMNLPESAQRIAEVEVGADTFLFGYPASLTYQIRDRFNPTKPLLRKGIVAGIDMDSRTIVIDCPSYHGNSGGPVVAVEDIALNAKAYRIIGVVTAFVPFIEEWENKTLKYAHATFSNSGYALVEPIDIAIEMVWK